MLDEKRHCSDLPERSAGPLRAPGVAAAAEAASSRSSGCQSGVPERWSTRRLLTVPGLSHRQTGKA